MLKSGTQVTYCGRKYVKMQAMVTPKIMSADLRVEGFLYILSCRMSRGGVNSVWISPQWMDVTCSAALVREMKPSRGIVPILGKSRVGELQF